MDSRVTKRAAIVFSFSALLLLSALPPTENPCDVVEVVRNPNGVAGMFCADSSMYLVNKMDSAGVFQIYVGKKGDKNPVCISHSGPASDIKPWKKRHKMQTLWHPSGKWIICAVEKEK